MGAGRWALSPAYNLNPVPEIDRRQTPKTAITEYQEEPSIAAAVDAAPRFGLKAAEAKVILRAVFDAVSGWRNTGKQLRIKASTIDVYATAFEHPGFAESCVSKCNLGTSRTCRRLRLRYAAFVISNPPTLSLTELRTRLRPLCEKHGIRRLEVFGSAARGAATAESDVDLLATFDQGVPIATAQLLEMAGEAEELVGRPVDFVLRGWLAKSPNRFAREHILATAVCVYGG